MSKDKQIAVLGAGLMGIGIATRFARYGYDVLVRDVVPASLASLDDRARLILGELAEAGLLDEAGQAEILARLTPVGDIADLAEASLVIEAVPERIELKHETYAQIEAVIAPGTIIGSNTSGYTPDRLAEGLVHPERFLITHFWSPPHAIPLVELVPGSRTAPEVTARTKAILEAIGATPVVLDKAIPGFVGNRIQFAVLREALAIIRSGAATAEVVDTVMQASLGRRWNMMGPLKGADLGGLDTFLDISTHLMPELAKGEDVLALLREKVEAGHTGFRSGEGFYVWTDALRDEIREKRVLQLSAGK